MFNKPLADCFPPRIKVELPDKTKQDNINHEHIQMKQEPFSHTIFAVVQNISCGGGMSFDNSQTMTNSNNSKRSRRRQEKLDKDRQRDRSRQRCRRRGRPGFGNPRSVKRSQDESFYDRPSTHSGGRPNHFEGNDHSSSSEDEKDELFTRHRRRRGQGLQNNRHRHHHDDDNNNNNNNNSSEENGAPDSLVNHVNSIVDPSNDLYDNWGSFASENKKGDMVDDGWGSFISNNKKSEMLDSGDRDVLTDAKTGLTDSMDELNVDEIVPPPIDGLDFSEDSSGETKQQKTKNKNKKPSNGGW